MGWTSSSPSASDSSKRRYLLASWDEQEWERWLLAEPDGLCLKLREGYLQRQWAFTGKRYVYAALPWFREVKRGAEGHQ